jgi:hypothetical protein
MMPSARVRSAWEWFETKKDANMQGIVRSNANAPR